MMMKKRKLLYYNYIIPALWSQQIVVLLIIISQLQFLSLCKSLAYLLLYFTYLLVLVFAFLLLKSKTASDSFSRDYLHWLFLLLSSSENVQMSWHELIILTLYGTQKLFILLFNFKLPQSAQQNRGYLRLLFHPMTKQRLFLFSIFLFCIRRFIWAIRKF